MAGMPAPQPRVNDAGAMEDTRRRAGVQDGLPVPRTAALDSQCLRPLSVRSTLVTTNQ